MPPADRRVLTGWGRTAPTAAVVHEASNDDDVVKSASSAPPRGVIGRGLGRSYNDAAQNAGGLVVDVSRSRRFHSFDPSTGVARVAAGVSIADLIEVCLPLGWFPPVTPGTRHVTVGGAIAADVHGKNHHGDGTLANFLESLTLLTAEGKALHCSRTEHADVFWATVGGLGLTGMILDARLRLRRVESSWLRVDYRRARDLDATLAAFAAADAAARYSVAWIDCLGRGRAMGRAVIMHGEHATAAEATAAGRAPFTAVRAGALAVPFDMPGALLSPLSVRLFNAAYYAAHRDGTRLVHFERFFYPLDGIAQWNRLYGRHGFTQYQVALPPEAGERGLVALLERLSGSGRPSFLAVLKRFGPQGPGMLSFPREGYTLALDLPVRPGLVEFLAELDRLVLARGGRVYLAKDATTTADAVRAMYPRLDEFRAIKARLDPRGVLSSSLARRLGLVA